MFFRYFLIICIVALFSVASRVSTAEIPESAATNRAAKIVAKMIGSLFTGAAVNCLAEAALKCKDYWKDPKGAVGCAKNFLQANKGRCVTSI